MWNYRDVTPKHYLDNWSQLSTQKQFVHVVFQAELPPEDAWPGLKYSKQAQLRVCEHFCCQL